MASGHRARDILDALAVAHGPQPLVRFHAAVLAAQMEIEAMARPPSLHHASARGRLAHGVPLLSERFVEAVRSVPQFRQLAGRICLLLAGCRPDLGTAVSAGLDAADEAVRACVLTHTGRAFLRPLGYALAPLVEEDHWRLAECPVCGGVPDLAALGEHGDRHLLCGRCDTTWCAPRFGCPFCRDDDPRDMLYHPVGDGPYRLYVCGRCRRYLKTIDLRQRPGACLPVERILTTGLDAAALAAGVGTESGARWPA